MNSIGHQNARFKSDCECEKELKSAEDKFEKALKDLKDANALTKELEDEVEDLRNLNQVLILKENMSNRELEDARNIATIGLRGIANNRTSMGIKRIGEIDVKPFEDICKKKYGASEDWDVQCATLCSSWEENIRNPHWHPFKNIEIHGRLQEVIDEEDEKLRNLREEWGNEVYEAVVRALLELNEYNPSGRYPVSVLWNSKEQRKASMKEIMEFTIKQCKKRKRN